jgi:hypothetical protein
MQADVDPDPVFPQQQDPVHGQGPEQLEPQQHAASVPMLPLFITGPPFCHVIVVMLWHT